MGGFHSQVTAALVATNATRFKIALAAWEYSPAGPKARPVGYPRPVHRFPVYGICEEPENK